MAKRFSKNALKMAETLGVDPKKIRNNLEESALLAVEAISARLKNMLDDLEATSESGSLLGYKVVYMTTEHPKLVLQRSGVTIPSGDYSFIVWVQASSWHQQLPIPLNVFDILDQGRKKSGTASVVVPLWGADPNRVSDAPSRLPVGGGRVRGRISVADQVSRKGAIRGEPRSRGQRVLSSERRTLVFREGPFRVVPGKNLYKRAFDLAKRRVGGIVDRRVWAVIYVPNREKWVK